MSLCILLLLVAQASCGLILKRDATCSPGSTLNGSQFKYLCYQEGQTVAYKPIACLTVSGKDIQSGQTYTTKNFEYLCTIDDVAKTASYQIDACYSASGTKMDVGSKESEYGFTYSCANNNGSVTLTFSASTTCFYGGNEYQSKAVWVDANSTTQLACIASGSSVVIQASGCVAPDTSIIPVRGYKQMADSGFLACVLNVTERLRAGLVGIKDIYCTDNVGQHILGSNWAANGYNYQCGLVNLTAATVGILPGTSKILAVGYAASYSGVWFQCRVLSTGVLYYNKIAVQNCTVGNNTYKLSTKYVVDNVQYQCSYDTAGNTYTVALQCITNNQTVVPINRIAQEKLGVAYQCGKAANGSSFLHLLSDTEYSLWKRSTSGSILPESITTTGATVTFTTATTTTTPTTTSTTPLPKPTVTTVATSAKTSTTTRKTTVEPKRLLDVSV